METLRGGSRSFIMESSDMHGDGYSVGVGAT